MNDLILKLSSGEFGGWTRGRVTTSIRRLSGAFEFEITEKYPGHLTKWEIKNGDPCSVLIRDESKGLEQILITGYIDGRNSRYDSKSHSIIIFGRDKAGDLVDSSHWVNTIRTGGGPETGIGAKNGEWKGLSLYDIVSQICLPFGISVVLHSSASGPAMEEIKSYKVIEGESVYSIIAKLCRLKTVLVYSLGNGNICLSRLGTNKAVDSLQLGNNILSANDFQDNRDRYSFYVVKSQTAFDSFTEDPDLPDAHEDQNISCVGYAEDSVLWNRERYRPLIIISDSPSNNKEAEERALWEATTRAGLSRRNVYVVQGWTQSDGTIWPLNGKVTVKDSLFGMDNVERLITDLTYRIGPGGTTTEITVMSPDALIPEPYSLPKIKSDLDSDLPPT